MTATRYSMFGVSMERQSARRKLVVLVYAVLAAFCAVSMIFARTEPRLFTWALYPPMAVALCVFGGAGRFGRWSGLIKPFANKPPRPEPVMVDVIRLQLNPLSAGTPDESSWKNDERELGRRNLAHYQAYRVLGLGMLMILGLAAFGMHAAHTALELHYLQWLTATSVMNVIYGVALIGTVLAMTLPSAIILWNEPDMDLG